MVTVSEQHRGHNIDMSSYISLPGPTVLQENQLVLDESIPDVHLRSEILWPIPSEEMATVVDGCHQLRDGDDGYHLDLTARW